MDQRMKRWPLILIASLAVTLVSYYSFGTENMKIKFDLGKNIIETARASGVPRFQADKIAGLVDYSINQVPPDIPAHYTRSGHEIVVSPLFAFTMYADEEHRNNLAVTKATLQVSQQAFNSHNAGQAFVEQLIGQFQNGQWQRHLRKTCPYVTGRSTLLNATGELNLMRGCPFDPDYRLTREEWLYMMQTTQYYEWVGDGVIATLSVGYSDDARGVTYSIFLEFEDEAVQKERSAKNKADAIALGEAKGWGTAVRMASQKKEREARNKLLEENALKRGDQIIPRY